MQTAKIDNKIKFYFEIVFFFLSEFIIIISTKIGLKS